MQSQKWIPESKFTSCIDVTRTQTLCGNETTPYFIGLDIALKNDWTALAIGHVDSGKVLVDKVSAIKAGTGLYEGKSELEFMDIIEWLGEETFGFNIVSGIFDQWAGIPFEQALRDNGFNQLQMVHGSTDLNLQMQSHFEELVLGAQISFYEGSYIQELREIPKPEERKSIHALHGMFDDQVDALIRVAWCIKQSPVELLQEFLALQASEAEIERQRTEVRQREVLLRKTLFENGYVVPFVTSSQEAFVPIPISLVQTGFAVVGGALTEVTRRMGLWVDLYGRILPVGVSVYSDQTCAYEVSVT